MITSEILLLEHQTLSTLTVEEFCYRPPRKKESDKTNKILSLVVTDLIEVIPPPIDDKPRLINLPLLYSKTILHISSLFHQEDHISLLLAQKTINPSLLSNNSFITFSLSACLGMVELTELLLKH